MLGGGEKERFGAEMLRLGQKYAKPMDTLERRALRHSLYYHFFQRDWNFEVAVDDIVRL